MCTVKVLWHNWCKMNWWKGEVDPGEYKGNFKTSQFVQCGQSSKTQRSWGNTKGVCSGIPSRKTPQVLISPSASVCCSADIYCYADRELWLCKPSQYFCTALDAPCTHNKLFKDLCLVPFLFYWWPAVWKLWSPFLASSLTWPPKPDNCTCRSSELKLTCRWQVPLTSSNTYTLSLC